MRKKAVFLPFLGFFFYLLRRQALAAAPANFT